MIGETWCKPTWFIRYHGCFNKDVLVGIVTCNDLLNDIKREKKTLTTRRITLNNQQLVNLINTFKKYVLNSLLQ